MTPNKEDYLKMSLWTWTRHNKITTEIAQLMQVPPPAVMMEKLIAEELLIKGQKVGYSFNRFGAKISFGPLS